MSKPRELPNIPRDDKVVKRAFISKFPAGALSYFDYKAIEPRLAAYLAAKIGHPAFAEQIRAGIDPYTAVARLVTLKDEVTKEERQVWKRVYLAIKYGAGAKRVQEVWIEEAKEHITLAKARGIVATFHENWPAIRALQNGIVETHQRRGYVRSLHGRHLHQEEYGEHKLLNKWVQGSAADVMKRAILNVSRYLRESDLESHMISVVHDDLQFDGPASEVAVLHEVIPPLMDEPLVRDIVPILVDHEVSSTSWADKVPFEEWAAQRMEVAA